MTIQDFMLEAKLATEACLGDEIAGELDITQTEIVKANDTRVHGLRISADGGVSGWNIYIDDLYERYEGGEPIEMLLAEVVNRCEDGLSAEVPVHPQRMDLRLESIRDRLTVRLLGVRNNMSYMSGRPYIDVGCGLALIAVINCDRSITSEWVLAVTDELLRSEIGCTREELLTAALENTAEIEAPMLISLSAYVYSNYVRPVHICNYLTEERADEEAMTGAFMLTNESTFFGAAVLFYPGVMEKIASVLGCPYYVLPSSVHELMIIPESAEPDVQKMKETVREANTSVVDRSEILSDNIFYYDTEKCELVIVRDSMADAVRERDRKDRSIA